MKHLVKKVTLVTCCRDFIKNVSIGLILTQAYDKAWLQLILLNFLIEFDAIFVFYFTPYGKYEKRQKEEGISIVQCMLFNYQMLCFSELVSDLTRREQMANFSIYYMLAIFGLKLYDFVMPYVQS